jgi:AcrR family transcriptional regulator
VSSGYLGTRPDRRAAHRQQMRASVVEAALKLFLERGHLAVSVEDIVDTVGISRATFYKYFTERDEILAELFAQLLAEAPAEPPPPDGPVPLRIRAMLQATAAQMVVQADLARFVYSVPLRHDAVLPGGIGEPPVFRAVHALVEEGRDHDEIRSDVPAEDITQHLARAFEAGMRDWAIGQAADAPERVAQLLDLAIGGVTA